MRLANSAADVVAGDVANLGEHEQADECRLADDAPELVHASERKADPDRKARGGDYAELQAKWTRVGSVHPKGRDDGGHAQKKPGEVRSKLVRNWRREQRGQQATGLE